MHSAAPAPDGLPMPQRLHALIVIVLGLMVSVLDASLINLALPILMQDLQASAAASIWILNAYQLTMLGLMLPFATLGERLGHRRVYLAGMTVFTLASLACALAYTLPALALARALQGLGAAGIVSVNAALVRLIYPRRMFGRGLAINSTVVAASTVAGPTIAAGILSIASWHWLFLINVPLGLLVLALGRKVLPANPPRPDAQPAAFSGVNGPRQGWTLRDAVLHALTFVLFFLGADGLGTYLDAVSDGETPAHRLPLAIALLAASLLIGYAYVRRQLRLTTPLLPLDLLRIRVFALSMCASLGAFSAQMIAFAGLPFLLLEAHGKTPLEAGALLTAWPLAIVVVAPIVGRLIGRVHGGLLGGLGMALLSTGLLLLALLPDSPANADIAWRLALCGTGFAIFQSPNNHIILTSGPAHRSGAAGGLLGTARLTGQTFGAVLLAAVFSVYPPTTPQGPTLALCLGAVFALISGTASAARIKR